VTHTGVEVSDAEEKVLIVGSRGWAPVNPQVVLGWRRRPLMISGWGVLAQYPCWIAVGECQCGREGGKYRFPEHSLECCDVEAALRPARSLAGANEVGFWLSAEYRAEDVGSSFDSLSLWSPSWPPPGSCDTGDVSSQAAELRRCHRDLSRTHGRQLSQ